MYRKLQEIYSISGNTYKILYHTNVPEYYSVFGGRNLNISLDITKIVRSQNNCMRPFYQLQVSKGSKLQCTILKSVTYKFKYKQLVLTDKTN